MDRRSFVGALIAFWAVVPPAIAGRRGAGASGSSRPQRKPRGARGSVGGGDKDAYYPNCSAARAAGAAPLRRGDGGYSRKLDRDGDGIACE